MECDRFKRLLKTWYVQVQDEALAPARMVELMENHISECSTCLMDPDARKDMEKIITLVLPKDKLSPPSRSNRSSGTVIDGSVPNHNDLHSNHDSDDGNNQSDDIKTADDDSDHETNEEEEEEEITAHPSSSD